MNTQNLQEALVCIAEILNADVPFEEAFIQVGKVMQTFVPYDVLGFHASFLGLNYQLREQGLEKRDATFKYDEKNDTKSAVQWVITHGKSLKRNHIKMERRFSLDQNLIDKGGLSQVIVPLITGGQTIGALDFVSHKTQVYTDTHVENALLCARLVASEINQIYVQRQTQTQLQEKMAQEVVTHTQELQERMKQREALLEINRAVQALQRSTDMQDVIEVFYKNLVDIGFDFRVLTIQRLIDDQKMIFEAYEVMDGHVYRKHIQVHERAFAIWKKQDVHYRRNLNVDLVDLKLGFIKRAKADIGLTVASTLSVPLGRGVISMLSTSVEAFDKEDIRFFEQLAGILSVGLNRVHDLERLEIESQRQAALAELSQAIQKMKRSSELGDVAHVYLQVIQRLGINAQAVAIHRILDAEKNLIETFRICENGYQMKTGQRQSIVITDFWRNKKVFYDPNLETIPDIPNFREKFQNLPIVSFVNMPFLTGVISVHSIHEDTFSEQDFELLQQIAEIFSLGIRRVEDLEAIEEQYKVVQENEARYRNLIRLVDGVAYMCDWRTHQYVYIDSHIKNLIGYDAKDLTPDFFKNEVKGVIHISRNESLPEDIKLTGEGKPPTIFRAEYDMPSKDGKMVRLADFAIEFRDENGELIYTIGVVQDMTTRYMMEEGVRQSQKMEAIGQLAGGVAHDFNNLLTGILGLTSLLLVEVPTSEPIWKDIKEIQNTGNRAADLTKQLLAFSRKQMIEPQILDLNSVMSNMHSMLRRLIREDIELIVSLGSVTKPVEIDRGQLEQVIMNLAVNAKDAMPQGGKLTLKTHQIFLDANQVRFMSGLETGTYALLEVGDTGLGMDAETAARIFEPFFTTKVQGQGTGLGLATVYGIVAQNKGHIAVESKPNAGAVFRIYLPLVDQPIDVNKEEDFEEVRGGTETILVAEDEEVVRLLIERTLTNLGYRVLVAQHGEEALRVWKESPYPIDLLLTDVIMPGIGGKALVKRLRDEKVQVPVLYMSGYTEEMIVDDGLGKEPQAFLQKPFIPNVLAQCVRHLLDQIKA